MLIWGLLGALEDFSPFFLGKLTLVLHFTLTDWTEKSWQSVDELRLGGEVSGVTST